MNVKTQPGDVYVLDKNRVLIYDSQGIALTLNQRNIETLRKVKGTLDCVKDSDTKDERFTVAYLKATDCFRFEPNRGERVDVNAWMLLEGN